MPERRPVMPKLRHINPVGYADLRLIGREGPAPYYVCHTPDADGFCPEPETHEHTKIANPEDGEPGSGCLIPGEVFEVSVAVAKHLLEQVGNYEAVPTTKKG